MQWLNDLINKHTKPAEGEAQVSAPVEESAPNQFQKYVTQGFLAPNLQPVKQKTPTKVSSSVEAIFDKVIQAESRGRHRDAKGELTTSPKGAQGISQVMPQTGVDPGYGVKPLQNQTEQEYVRFGKDLLHAYTKEMGGDMAKGLAAYNWGIGNMKSAVNKHGDDWKANLPRETKTYLNKILGKQHG